ncbi:unnamed protein product [Rhizophagus irregularis]|nr:unnamed protein product [Rhizophagus irregularis]
MSDIYEVLEVIKEKHWKEKHMENKEEYQRDPSCLKCYSTNEIKIDEWFEGFWKIFNKAILEAMSYNRNTYVKLQEYVILMRKDGEERYPPSKKKRNKEFEKKKKEGEKLLDIVVVLIRYRNKPDLNKEGIKSVIRIICEHYMFDEEDNLIINERKTEENLLGNKELLKWGSIIEDDELDIRFTRFGEWLEEKESVEIKDKGYKTMRYLKEILHLEEKGEITNEENRELVKKFQKSITYQWWNRNKYPKPWINDDLTDEIVKKIVETKGFTEEDSDVGELENSDNTEELSSNEGDEQIERIYRNYWSENGYEIDIEEIRWIIKLGIDYEIMKTKDFMEKYMTIKELDDEKVKEEIKRWYNIYVIECPLCNKMLLIREAIEYNEYFTGRICETCFEKEKNINNGTEIEKRLKQLKKLMETSEVNITDEELLRLIDLEYKDIDILDEEFIELFQKNIDETNKKLKRILDEHLGIFDEEESNDKEIESRMMKIKETCKRMKTEITEGEILRMLRMGYSNKEILSWGFIKLFQENKNELEEVIKEILDKYLRKQIEIEKNDKKEDSEDELGEILSPEEYEIWEEDTREFEEDELENVINTEGFDSSQNSDSNSSLNIKDSDTESEIFDYNLQDLFQENILVDMATENQIKRIIENAFGFPANTLNGAKKKMLVIGLDNSK